jgi:hypothetical protein
MNVLVLEGSGVVVVVSAGTIRASRAEPCSAPCVQVQAPRAARTGMAAVAVAAVAAAASGATTAVRRPLDAALPAMDHIDIHARQPLDLVDGGADGFAMSLCHGRDCGCGRWDWGWDWRRGE